MKETLRKILIIISILILCTTLSTGSIATDISDLDKQKKEVSEELNKKNKQLEYVNEELTTALLEIQKLDDEILQYETDLNKYETQLSKLQTSIDEAIEKIDLVQEDYQTREEKETTEFAWIADITITKNNARKIVNAGRNRWKIENQGFNRQKHWQGNIEHACSWNEQAQKNHYLMEQIADFIKQLYEYFYLAKNEIKKLQKNISPELLASFGRQPTKPEDIKVELHSAVLN